MNRRQAVILLSAGLLASRLNPTWAAAEAAAEPPIRDALAGAPAGTDQYLDRGELQLVGRIIKRLQRLEKVVGHANFNLLDHSTALRTAGGYKSVGAFTREEREFIERLFHTDAAEFGFAGPRLIHDLGYSIAPQSREKVLYTGHYLFKERALETYERLRRDIGEQLLLTSGIRGVVKQTHLFLARVQYSRGNISEAGRSLAPPAYSFHALGDFDVGQSDFGYANFTRRFVESDVYRRLQQLDYVSNRYSVGNPLGMRFEPWHVEVV